MDIYEYDRRRRKRRIAVREKEDFESLEIIFWVVTHINKMVDNFPKCWITKDRRDYIVCQFLSIEKFNDDYNSVSPWVTTKKRNLCENYAVSSVESDSNGIFSVEGTV